MNIQVVTSSDWRARIQTVLKDTGRSKREVSISAGLSQNYLHEVLAGKEPTISRLEAIAATLNVSVAFLLGESAA